MFVGVWRAGTTGRGTTTTSGGGGGDGGGEDTSETGIEGTLADAEVLVEDAEEDDDEE